MRRSSGGHSGKGYIRHKVQGDGDCGYTAFGITRSNAFDLLVSHIHDEAVTALLQPVVYELLHTKKFYDYLIEKKFIVKTISFEAMQSMLEDYSKNCDVIKGYIHYEIREKTVDMGWAHPGVLQALAHIQKIEIYM